MSRRKKCDKTRPACGRCVKGKFECLGYDYCDEEEEDAPLKWRGVKLELKPILPKPAGNVIDLTRTIDDSERTSRMSEVSPGCFSASNMDISSGPRLSPNGSSPQAPPSLNNLFSFLSETPGVSAGNLNECQSEPEISDVTRFNDWWPQNQSQSLVRPRSRFLLARTAPGRRAASHIELSPLMKNLIEVMNVLCYSIPVSLNTDASRREYYCVYILGEYEVRRVRKLFRPPPDDIRSALVSRVRRSGMYLWFAYLGTKIFKTLDETPKDGNVQPYLYWVDKFDRQATTHPCRNPPIEELEDRLAGLIELAFLKFIAVSSSAGYSLLHRLLPTFFQVVAAYPSLWSERNGLLVSRPRALASSRYEIRRFVFYDTMTAFTFGLPQLVEYDTGTPEQLSMSFEWVHGIPLELIISIVKVNMWRSSYPGVPNPNDWLELEMRTVGWVPKVEEISGGESVEVVARLAVQESWRHAVLIYIYMGMCCVSCDDFRVQYSVQQIIRLMNVIGDAIIDVHLVTPLLVAGVAARYEHQRTAIQDKLETFCNTRIWLCRGSELASVLDHLWHGVARDGGAVTWEDYVLAREMVLPIL